MTLSPFARKLLRWRLANGYTQVQAAAAFGMHPNSFARLERGEYPPGPRTRRMLELLFNPVPKALKNGPQNQGPKSP